MPRIFFLVLFWLSMGLVWNHPFNAESAFNSPLVAQADIMPDRLRDWVVPPGTADYADQIQQVPNGDLRWRHFPVRVAIQPVEDGDPWTMERDRLWVEAMQRAIEEWQVYFPLMEVAVPVAAEDRVIDPWRFCDINIQRSRPPAQRSRDGTILPARLADARYLFLSPLEDTFTPAPTAEPMVSALRFRIRIGTQQGAAGLQATARHELGHALGLWGHSPDPGDVMYAAQTGLYPTISDRDVQTLKLVYSQSQLTRH